MSHNKVNPELASKRSLTALEDARFDTSPEEQGTPVRLPADQSNSHALQRDRKGSSPMEASATPTSSQLWAQLKNPHFIYP